MVHHKLHPSHRRLTSRPPPCPGSKAQPHVQASAQAQEVRVGVQEGREVLLTGSLSAS
jgi:hypothetical protein